MKQYIVPIIFLSGTLFLGYLYVKGPSPKHRAMRGQASKKGVSFNKLQQYKKEVQIQHEIRKQAAEMRKVVGKPELDPGYKKRNRFHHLNLDKNLGPAADELGRGTDDEPVNLDQRMDAFLAKKQEYEELETAQRRAYVETFIDEAYKMGYRVTISPDLEVTNVEKIQD